MGRPSVLGFYGQTGSTGAKATDQSDGAAQARFHGVLAPNSRYRERVTTVSVREFKKTAADLKNDGLEEPDLTVDKRKGLCWAKRLKRVFNGAAQVLK